MRSLNRFECEYVVGAAQEFTEEQIKAAQEGFSAMVIGGVFGAMIGSYVSSSEYVISFSIGFGALLSPFAFAIIGHAIAYTYYSGFPRPKEG